VVISIALNNKQNKLVSYKELDSRTVDDGMVRGIIDRGEVSETFAKQCGTGPRRDRGYFHRAQQQTPNQQKSSREGHNTKSSALRENKLVSYKELDSRTVDDGMVRGIIDRGEAVRARWREFSVARARDAVAGMGA
jgi:hypothetical protein